MRPPKNSFVFIILFACLIGCSPQKRLNRLTKNHPELIKRDTVFATRSFTVEGSETRGDFNASADNFGLEQILSPYFPDSVQREQAGTVINNYIVNRSCIKDTLVLSIPGGGWCKVFQTGGVISCLVKIPERIHTVSVPAIVNNLTPQIVYRWELFLIGIAVGILIGLMAVFALVRTIRKFSLPNK